MKKKTLFFISLLSFGISLFYFPNIVSAKELSLEEIETKTRQIGDITVEETMVPNELADEWAQLNGWDHEVDKTHKLTEDDPYAISTFGASPPSLSYWNVKSKGRYSFSGTFRSTNALYTNYFFRGATKYRTEVKNHRPYTIGYQARDRFATYYSTNIHANATLYTTVTLNSSLNNFYLKFFPVDSQSGSVSGYIEKR